VEEGARPIIIHIRQVIWTINYLDTKGCLSRRIISQPRLRSWADDRHQQQEDKQMPRQPQIAKYINLL